MTQNALFGVVDVQYDAVGGARAALVASRHPSFEQLGFERVVGIEDVAPYEAGALFRRELPCIRAVLDSSPIIDLLIVDGYATLDPQGRPGLGAHASEALGIPVIGVAKTLFRTATHAAEVRRGAGTRPLYVTAVGLTTSNAGKFVAEMAGKNRIPDALARADRLARGLVRPVASRR